MRIVYIVTLALAILCAWAILAHATEITPEAIEYYKQFAPPRVIKILQHFNTFEELEQFAKDRREVRKCIKHKWQRDPKMHALWKKELRNFNIYRDILNEETQNEEMDN